MTYQDINSPSDVRKKTLKMKDDFEKPDLQTIGGLLLDTEMRSEDCDQDFDNVDDPTPEIINIDDESEIDDDDYESEDNDDTEEEIS